MYQNNTYTTNIHVRCNPMFKQLVYEIVTGAGSPHARVYTRKQFITNDIIFFQMPCIKILMFVSNYIFVNMSYIYDIVYSICTR